MKLPILLTLCLFLVFGCTQEKEPIEMSPLVGIWKIYDVDQYETDSLDWVGIDLSIEQSNLYEGAYFMPDTPFDSIWHSAGIWESANETSTQLMFDDSISVDISLADNHDTLLVSMILPWTNTNQCQDIPVCVLEAPQWDFYFRRVR